MKNYRKKLLCAGLSAVLLLSGCGMSSELASVSDSSHDEPTLVTVWNYYNGQQLKAFDKLVSEFNDTVGNEKGILVESHSLGTVYDLEQSVLDTVNHKVGANELPNIFAAYVDTAYAVDKLGYVADLKPYLSQEEIDKFVNSYIEEGELSGDGSIKIFPVAKSTEIFMLNKTDWDKFAEATGADINDLKTIEGLTKTAQDYYEWTDSQTPEANDGKAFFGRDAMANYFLIGARQLGTEIFSVEDGKAKLNFDKDVIRKIWDNYYVPFVKGYFAASGKFRSDDIKTSNIIAFTGASSGATFLPDQVTVDDTERYPIEMEAMECPEFEGGEHYAVQQGAGMVVTKTEDEPEEQIEASVEFLKWFTQDERNIQFSLDSGYMPVTKEANNLETIEKNTSLNETDRTFSVVKAAIDTVNHNTLYTTKAFENGKNARSILEYSMSDKAAEDRKTVVENLQKGQTLEQASAEFTGDECFEKWYQETKEALEKLIK